MAAASMQVNKLEERWTPTTIQATYDIRDLPPCTTKSRTTPVPLPLLHFGWSFTLSLAPKTKSSTYKRTSQWTATTFSFLQPDNDISWGNTSIHAELLLRTEQHESVDPSSTSEQDTSSKLIGPIEVTLAQTPSAQLQLTPSSYILPLDQTIQARLTVTILESPFLDGLFQAGPPNYGSEAEATAQTQFVKQSGERVLSHSLTTGKLFDIKFLSFSTRSSSGNIGKPLPTYASLAVLKKHLNLPDTKLGSDWALRTLDDSDSVDSKHAEEILCPKDDEYDDLDSDYEDEEGFSIAVNLGPLGSEGKPEKSSPRSSSSSFSDVDRASGPDLVGCQLEEIINDPEPLHLLSEAPEASADCEPSTLIKFAAHKTWRVFLWYCYTGHVEFDKLRSQVEPGVERPRLAHTLIKDGAPSCSPKSMYRLADLLGDKVLKAKALQAITERMSEANVLDEMFSVFASRYSEVREVQLNVLQEHCRSPGVKKDFIRKIRKYSNIPHAEPVLSAFYDRFVV